MQKKNKDETGAHGHATVERSWASRSISDEERALIRQGVDRGWVAYDEEDGLVHAYMPPLVRSPFDPLDDQGWDECEASMAEQENAKEVGRLLVHGDAQLAALSMLAVDVVDVGVQDQFAARSVLSKVLLVAEAQAPPASIERAADIVRREVQSVTEGGIQPWMVALETAIETAVLREAAGAAWGDPRDSRDPAYVLDLLAALVSDMPWQFRARKHDHMCQAVRFMASVRLREVVPDKQPRGRGRRMSAWTAAARFAQCFRVLDMPERRKDTKRKTENRREKNRG